jgi:Tol biopolymer transport system component
MQSIGRFATILAAFGLACGDAAVTAVDPADPDPNTMLDLIVSEAIVTASPATNGARAVSYVSLSPGALPRASGASIRNVTRGGAPLPIVLVDGGFDPVTVAAEQGDVLELRIDETNNGRGNPRASVPASRRPAVVRTLPAHGSNAEEDVRPTVVFSEPLDARTVSAAAMELRGTATVDGTVRIGSQPWLVEFVPAAPLQAETTYWLTIAETVSDLQGESLTGSLTVPLTIRPEPLAGSIAFVSDRDGQPHIYLGHADGSGAYQLVAGQAPAWSASGERVAFHRQGADGRVRVYIINADGSGEKFLAEGHDPAWSPDDADIAFDGEGGIFAVDASGAGVPRKLIADEAALPRPAWFNPASYDGGWVGNPSWSPDGRSIAFVRDDLISYDWGTARTVYIVNADGSDIRLLTVCLPDDVLRQCWAERPSWSADGSRIALVLQEFPSSDLAPLLVSVPDTGGDREVHYRGSKHYVGSPDWSNGDSRIVFDQFASPLPQDARHVRIFVLNPATGAVRQLIPDVSQPLLPEYSDYHAVWHPRTLKSHWDYPAGG